MRIVTWNMNHKGQSDEKRSRAWEYLRDGLRADLALVQEASPPKTFPHVYRPIGSKSYQWGSAVVALSATVKLRERPRVPLAECYLVPIKGDELPDSHPGASAVADVLDESEQPQFTAISLYGQWEDMPDGSSYSCARVHRMLSDLTSVLSKARRRGVVLAGDLNTTTQGATSKNSQAAIVFGRLQAWGLIDCVSHTRGSRPRIPSCTCPDGDACSHVRTYRHNHEVDSEPTQWDYAFASETLVRALEYCRVVDETAAWELSDHCPILLEVNVDTSTHEATGGAG